VDLNQFGRTCMKLGLPKALCLWLQSFMEDRTIQLAFDGESQSKISMNAGIPQGSPVSPIMFLIYLHPVLKSVREDDPNFPIKIPSYMDDIALIT